MEGRAAYQAASSVYDKGAAGGRDVKVEDLSNVMYKNQLYPRFTKKKIRHTGGRAAY